MGLFGRKKEPLILVTDNFTVTVDIKSNQWFLDYRNVEFNFESAKLVLPTTEKLDEYISIVEKKLPFVVEEMKLLTNGDNSDGSIVNFNNARVSLITVENEFEFSASILGDESWGDMGYDIWYRGGEIINEGFGD
ncbi:MAG: hypothetical protein WBC60_00025 [Cognaticolwellia sp.]